MVNLNYKNFIYMRFSSGNNQGDFRDFLKSRKGFGKSFCKNSINKAIPNIIKNLLFIKFGNSLNKNVLGKGKLLLRGLEILFWNILNINKIVLLVKIFVMTYVRLLLGLPKDQAKMVTLRLFFDLLLFFFFLWVFFNFYFYFFSSFLSQLDFFFIYLLLFIKLYFI